MPRAPASPANAEPSAGWSRPRLQALLQRAIAKYRWIDSQVWTIAKKDSPEETKGLPPKPPMRCC